MTETNLKIRRNLFSTKCGDKICALFTLLRFEPTFNTKAIFLIKRKNTEDSLCKIKIYIKDFCKMLYYHVFEINLMWDTLPFSEANHCKS